MARSQQIGYGITTRLRLTLLSQVFEYSEGSRLLRLRCWMLVDGRQGRLRWEALGTPSTLRFLFDEISTSPSAV